MKRILCIAGVAVLALPAVLAVYREIIGRDIAPADFSDLALPAGEPVLPEENAYTYFVKAAEALVLPDTIGTNELSRLQSYLRDNRTNLTVIAKVISDNEELFRNVRQGVQCRHCVFPEPTTENLSPFPISGLVKINTLLHNKVSYEQASGNIDAALQDAHTLLRYGQLLRQTPSCAVALLVGLGLEGTGLATIQQLARDTQLSVHHLKRLMDYANAVPPYDVSVQYAFKAEFQLELVSLGFIPIKEVKETLSGVPLILTSFRRNRFFLLHQTQLDLANNIRAIIPEVPKVYADMSGLDALDEDPRFTIWNGLFGRNPIGELVTATLTPAFGHILASRCSMDGNLSATRIIIACQLFQRETGQRPQTLDGLVPDYLPSVPPDPFDGQPFRYKPDEGVIYFLGAGLKDFGGAAENPRKRGNVILKIWE